MQPAPMIHSDDFEQLGLWLRSGHGLLLAGVFGLTWGSFANVCIHRIPRGESLVYPPSACPHCGAQIAWYDNLPLVSWLLLRGRCRRCQGGISAQYPLIELVAALLALAVFRRFVIGDSAPLGIALSRFLTYFFFVITLLVLSVIDLRIQLLPDRITYPAIPLFFVLGRICGQTSLADAAIGLVAGYAVIWGIATGYRVLKGREGLGLGDAKLLSLIGGLLGWHALPWTLFLGSVSGLLLSVPILLIRRRGSDEGGLLHSEVPFGPFLSLAAAVYVFFFVGRDPLSWLILKLSSWV
jgi:leader peptidase (prepilin peptidase)/N-methyltransferase